MSQALLIAFAFMELCICLRCTRSEMLLVVEDSLNCRFHKQLSSSAAYTQRARASLQRIISGICQLTLQESRALAECQALCQPEMTAGSAAHATSTGDEQGHACAPTCTSAAVPGESVDAWRLLDEMAAAHCSKSGHARVPKEDCLLQRKLLDRDMHAGVLQWLAALGTYVASTYMWLWQHAPRARVAERVCVQWVGASVGEVEALPLLEALLLHSLPHCQVQTLCHVCVSFMCHSLSCALVRGQGIVFRHYYKSIAKGAGKGFRDGAVALFK